MMNIDTDYPCKVLGVSKYYITKRKK